MTLVVSRLVCAMCFFALIAHPAFAQMVTGTATYRERMALPPGALFEAVIEDVSRADAPASTLATTRIMSPGNPPIAFTITYDPAKVLPDRRYVVRARIVVRPADVHDRYGDSGDHARRPDERLFDASAVRQYAGRKGTAASGSSANPPLEGTYWKASELAGKPLAPQDAKREANLVFEAGSRVSGSDGCNRVTGTFARKGTDGLAFGRMAGTQKACLDNGEMDCNFALR
jgi:putative lipoprotein